MRVRNEKNSNTLNHTGHVEVLKTLGFITSLLTTHKPRLVWRSLPFANACLCFEIKHSNLPPSDCKCSPRRGLQYTRFICICLQLCCKPKTALKNKQNKTKTKNNKAPLFSSQSKITASLRCTVTWSTHLSHKGLDSFPA